MQKLKELIQKLNEKGVPLPVLQDMVTKKPSITYSTFIVATLIYIVSLFDAAQKALGGIDKAESGEFFLIAAGLYLGRAMSRKQANVAQAQNQGGGNDSDK